MKENKLRQLIEEGRPTCSTRLWSTWPFYTEAVGYTGNFDYIEYVAEYSPFSQLNFWNSFRRRWNRGGWRIRKVCMPEPPAC